MPAINPLRISRLSGFGSKPPQDFDRSPVTLGTASSCHIRFDAVLDKGVGPQHARLEWNGEAWYLLDGGTPAGIWLDGRRLEEPLRAGGEFSFRLGQSGPGVSVHVLPASVMSEVPVAPLPVLPPPKTKPRLPVAGIVVAIVLAVAILAGGGVFIGRKLANPKNLDFSAPAQEEDFSLTDPVFQAQQAQQQLASTPPGPQPWDQTGPDEEDLTWLPMEPSYQYSTYVQGWTPGSGSSPFTGDLSSPSLAQEFAQLSIRPPQFVEEPGGGLPPQSAGAIWTTDDTRLAVELMLAAEYGANPPPDTEAQGGLPAQGAPGVFVPGNLSPEELQAVEDQLGRQASKAAGGNARHFAKTLRMALDTEARNAGRQRLAASAREEGATSPDVSPQVWAVIVGIDDFENINDIVGCKNDAIGMAKILMLHGLLHPKRTYLMTDKMQGAMRPTGANIKRALNEVLTKAGPNDMVVFFFSGHGGEDPASGETVFTGVDFTFDDPLDTGLTGSALQSLIKRSAASKLLMFFDACHAGGLAPLGRNPRGFRSGVNPTFLDQLAEGRGHVVIRAAAKEEMSIGSDKLNHGIFTFVTLAGLTGGADRDKDGIVTLSELRPYVTRETPKLAKQLGHDVFHPSFTSGGQAGEIGDIPLTIVPPPAPKK